MPRLLIADAATDFADAVKKQLNKFFEIMVCHDGTQALELISSFVPDILLLDLMLPNLDGLSVLYNLRAVGNKVKVITLSGFYDDSVLARIAKLDVSCALMKPCALSNVVARVHELAREQNTGQEGFCLESETEDILLQLSFRLDVSRCACVQYAIRERFFNEHCFVTKELYPAVAKRHNGTITQVEKAVRDCIKDAFANGNKAVWRLYFPSGKCPSNEVFIGRIVVYLQRLCRKNKILDKAL